MNLIKKLVIICTIIFVIIVTGLLIFLGANKKDKIIMVNFNTNGGSLINSQVVNRNGMVNKPKDPTKEGYEFIEWTLNNEVFNFTEKVKKEITLNARWKKSTEKYFNVEFNTSGGNVIQTQTIKENEKALRPTNPIKNGYTFKGWYIDNIEYDFNIAVTKNIKLEAKWVKNPVVNNNIYKVSFVLDNQIINEQDIKHGNTVIAPTNPIKENYEFIGWMANDQLFNLNTKITKNLVLTAVFQAPVDTSLVCYTYDSFNTFRPVQISHVQVGDKITCEVKFEAYQTHKIKEAQYELYFGNGLELINKADITNAQINGRAYKYTLNSASNRTNIGIFTFEVKNTYHVSNLFIRLDNIKYVNQKNELITKSPYIINLQSK